MVTKCPYHNRILVKKIVKVRIGVSLATRNGVYRVCPVPGCDYKVKSDEEA